MARSLQVLDGYQVAQKIADRLKSIYGGRLRRVILFGSWARGEADPEASDVDLLVILDNVGDERTEWDRVGAVADELAVEAGRPIVTFPVSESEFRSLRKPLLKEALKDGVDFYPTDGKASA
jgi:predicted nucleotidyltransferase